ncbi:MAG TPA: hypothetical protein EYO78_08425 [Gammaproteobacteria bacterium]|nr:hypothetical protein [Gammaproteobacteria bacterium]
MASAALRLARFNTSGDLNSFTGLPSPAAAGLVASAAWVGSSGDALEPSILAIAFMTLITLLAGLLMVSNFTYFSPKRFGLKGRVPFITFVVVVMGFAVVLVDPPLVLLLAGTAYALSGPCVALFRWVRNN